MRKLVLSAVCLALTAVAFASDANPYQQAPRPAVLAGDIAVDYTLLQDGSVWNHVYTIQSFDAASGNFSGIGHLIPDPSYTEIITGTVVGQFVTFHILYTGANANYQVDAMGTLDDSGRLRGTAISVGQNFTWTGTPTPR